MDPTDLLIKATLLVIIFNSNHDKRLLTAVVILCPLAFFAKALHRSAPFWFLLTAIQAIAVYHRWFSVDNHKYLSVYWSFAVALALCTRKPDKALALNGRVLLGLVFAFATMWKVMSPDYLNGSFFQYHLLLDFRFWPMASWLGGLPQEVLVDNARLYGQMTMSSGVPFSVQLKSSLLISWIAQILTWWTVVLEAAISIVFLAPSRRVSTFTRNVLLWLFTLTTYVWVPIIGFASSLLVMGLAQTELSRQRDRKVYLILLLASPVYLLLWRKSLQYVFNVG
ncbi:MAG TPA: hypothetical protein VNL14_01810 [Candidatus Acidoferrales bacterium]|nr:hypothetical protein [Candidatus Acidoferrales bacterium]